MKRIARIALLALSLSFFMPIANADTDPFPGVANGQEIPGTKIWSSPGVTQSQWEATDAYKAFSCPAGSGNGMGVDMNFTSDNSDDRWFAYCVKTWTSQVTQEAISSFNKQVEDGKAAALALSQAWNTANPGQQKCFQWGPFIDPRGGESSGGVCANPVGSLPVSGGTDTSTVKIASDTKTAITETKTVVVVETRTVAPNASPVADDTNLPNEDPEIILEDSIAVLSASPRGSVVEISSNYPSSKLTVVATKKGAKKKLIFNVSTNLNGDYKFKTGYNLSGYTVVLFNGKTELDRDLLK